MTDSNPLVLYDISSPLQPRSFAPNPSKARYALSFKRVPFKTIWVDQLDISTVRRGLKCPATRKFDDGSDFDTLPMVQDPVFGAVVGDSFDIAHWLEEKFPDSGGCLFPQSSTRTGLEYESPAKDTLFFAPITTNEGHKNEAYAKFNLHVDATFSSNMLLFGMYLPFNPDTAEATKERMCKRAHLKSWDDLIIEGEARKPLMTSFKDNTASLAQFFTVHQSGPYLEGKEANYADLIVGGWLNMLASTIPKEEWAEIKMWHGGVFGRLHDALQKNYFVV